MNVPKLRFKEFSGEWEEKSFRDIVSLNLVPVEKPSADYVRLGIRSHGKGTFHELVKIENLLEADKMFLVPKDNLILNITFAWEHAIAITSENDEGKYVSGRFPTFAFKKNEVPAFYESIIRSKRMKYELGVASPGGAGRNRVLNKELFLDIPVKTTGFEEQTKIAEFVKCIDEKIENQKLIVESLENQKKGLMQKIFSQQLRFKDDDGKEFPNWNESMLGRICVFRRGSFPQPYGLKQWYDEVSGNPFVQVVDVGENMQLKSSTKNKISKMAEPYSVFVPKGTMVITLQGSIGRVAKTQYDAYVDRTLLIISGYNVDMDIDYFKYELKNIFDCEKRKAPGGIIKTITKEALSTFKVRIPCIDEQRKISKFVQCMEEKIMVENQVLKHWQQIKKGLLQQMFV